jgi:uncharacterized protein (DUF1697 family)
MGRWFAFLRAINTGDRRLTNEALLAPFGELGFTDVAAYQAAGNVTFGCDDPGLVDEGRIEDVLAEAYGFEVPTFVRSAGEVAALVVAEPFTAKELASTAGKVQVAFLRSAPTPDQLVALHALAPAEDRVVVIGREWYWLPVEGISASQLPVSRVEGVLGELTMRTLGTVQRMAAKYA